MFLKSIISVGHNPSFVHAKQVLSNTQACCKHACVQHFSLLEVIGFQEEYKKVCKLTKQEWILSKLMKKNGKDVFVLNGHEVNNKREMNISNLTLV